MERNTQKKLIVFDLEGPLSPMDHALSSMGLIGDGEKIFAVISRYDDLLTLEGREGYEPGDTLSLIVPFLLSYSIREEDLREVSNRAQTVPGSKELVLTLKNHGWQVYIASTSYAQHALNVGGRLGIKSSRIFCTNLDLNRLHSLADDKDFSLVKEAGTCILRNLYSDSLEDGSKDNSIKSYLDEFFWQDLSQTSLGRAWQQIQVMGGRRKVKAVEMASRENDAYLNEVVVVGDSITDFQMLKVVEAAGGLAVVFNGNEYALPYGTASLATSNMKDILFVLNQWLDGGREGLRLAIRKLPAPDDEEGPFYDWLVSKNADEMGKILRVHKKMRALVRGEAVARLG
jgi:energy-converting hydrogenase A subunit R